jgi:rod shape-determining protein MreC
MRPKSRAERARLEVLGRVGSVPSGRGRRLSEPGRGVVPASPVLVLLLTLGVAVVLGVLHNRWTDRGQTDPALAGVRTAVFPFQIGAARARSGARTAWDWLLPGKRQAEEIEKLRAEVARLKQENAALQSDAAEAARLREAVGLVQKSKEKPLAAEVIGLLPSANFDSVTVARGSRDGVKPGTVARTPDGLVGQVTEVSPVSARVMLLTDINSGVGVLVTRNGKQKGVGIARGRGRGESLELVYLRQEDDVKAGDAVVSSGYGGVIPPGIPVGVVAEVKHDSTGFLKSARIVPAAPLPGALREVYLIR